MYTFIGQHETTSRTTSYCQIHLNEPLWVVGSVARDKIAWEKLFQRDKEVEGRKEERKNQVEASENGSITREEKNSVVSMHIYVCILFHSK